MNTQLRVTKNNPIQTLRHYEVIANGHRAGYLHKSGKRWYVGMIKDPLVGFPDMEHFYAPNYHTAVRIAACYVEDQKGKDSFS